MEIDLVQLCASVGARLIHDPVVGIDHERQEILFAERPPIRYDVLSIGIGSKPSMGEVQNPGDAWLPIKPMQDFLPKLASKLEQCVRERTRNTPLRIYIVGAGLAGIEILFCLQAFIRNQHWEPVELSLVTRSDRILPELLNSSRRRVLRAMQKRGLQVMTGRSVVAVGDASLRLHSGEELPADVVIWATGASAREILGHLGLP